MNRKIDGHTIRKFFAIALRLIFGLIRFHKRKSRKEKEAE